MLRLIFILILIVSAQNTLSSGGTMVGNGGGFAEMQAVYINQLLPSYFTESEEHKPFLDFLKNNIKELTFNEDCEGISKQYILSNPYHIPSCLLYSDHASELGPLPKSFPEIGAIIFSFYWLRHSPSASWSEAQALGLSIFNATDIKQEKTTLTWRSKIKATVIVWDIITHLDLQQQVTIELLNLSLNILPHLKEAMNCQAPYDIEFKYLSLLNFNSDLIFASGPVTWNCDDKDYSKVINISLNKLSSEGLGDVVVKINFN